MIRQPVVAGRFYDDNPTRLNEMVDRFLGEISPATKQTLLAMVPHAGYVFSGSVCGQTFAIANLAETIILLGPNHTGRGERFSVWADGSWDIPGGSIPVNGALADLLLKKESLLKADTDAHVGEHSLEVILPFLHRLNPATTIVPIAISAFEIEALQQVGESIASVIKSFNQPVSIVVSSDMSHYISHDQAKEKDSLALDAAVNLDPRRLFSTVRQHEISMCGVLPMTTGLFAGLSLGASKGELVTYATSGEVSGDFDQVVGYAGVLVS